MRARAKSASVHHAALNIPYVMVIEADQHFPSMVGSHAFARGLHWNHWRRADGIMIMNRVTIQNHTNHRRGPVVSRRRVTPNEILDRVADKLEIEATTELPSAIVARFSTGMSMVRFPNPSSCPICVVMASARRISYLVSVQVHVAESIVMYP